MLAQIAQIPLRQRQAVHEYLARTGVEKAWQQVHQGGLARSRGADQCHHFTGAHLQADPVQRRSLVLAKSHDHIAQFNRALYVGRALRAALLNLAVFHQCQPAFQSRHAAGDRVGHIGHAAQGGNQHQHGADEGHKAAYGHVVAAALPQGNTNHGRQCHRCHQLGGGGHRCRGNRGLDIELAQLLAEFDKPLRLRLLRTVQAHHAVCQHVFFDHIRQRIGGLLAAFGDAVQALGQGLHDPAHRRHDEGNRQCQLPVQIQQVGQQGHQRETVTRNGQKCLHQLRGPSLHFIHHRVGQGAGRLLGKQIHLCQLHPFKQILAQAQHAFIRNPRQRILPGKLCKPTDKKQPDDEQRHHPQIQGALGKTAVKQRLQQCGNQWLGGGTY